MSEPRKPTEKEAFFFLTILGAMKNKPEVDWELVAERSGYKTGKSARDRFNAIKAAIGAQENGNAPADGASTPTKATPKARAKKEVGSGTNTTPSKVKKATTPRKPRTPKLKKGELSDLQEDKGAFLSNSNGNANGGVKAEAGEEEDVAMDELSGGAKYEEYDEPEESS